MLNRQYLPLAAVLAVCLAPAARAQNAFRPPAVPLVAHDPYFSVWSTRDNLTDDWSRHWTGATNAMVGMARIDGRTYRFAGPQPDTLPTLTQTGVSVWPTRTIYRFHGGGVNVSFTFTTPALPRDVDVLSRPLTYLTWDVASADKRAHSVSLYFDATGEWAVNNPDQAVTWGRVRVPGGTTALRIGTQAQPVLAKAGDNIRIDWGHFYLGVPPGQGKVSQVIAGDRAARDAFAQSGTLPARDDTRMPRAAKDDWPVLALAFYLGRVTPAAPVSRVAMLAYDDEFSIEYLKTRLRPYWRRSGMDAAGLLAVAARDYPTLAKKCRAFDETLMADLTRTGGAHYAELCALAYRQCLAAHKIVAAPDGKTPLMFSKENFSNGCIATVDVLYPAAPFFLLFNTDLLKAQLIPVLDYTASPRWKFPFAPHDLGTYPLANGQVYGGGERTEENQMPVEETGNLLILLGALARRDNNADFAVRYWPTLQKWAAYLRDKGLDPENQLCTDDFAGHLAHNTNLSLKAIEALGAYALLARMAGKTDEAASYDKTAREFAARWVEMAGDGDHFRLAFDRPGTWSQKYNLVWDRILGLNLFSPDVARTEIAFYKRQQNPFGLPLDNRADYTKADWLVWTATLAESPADFATLTRPLRRFVNESPSRVPFTDWYDTKTARQRGFQARSVIGGIFIKALADAEAAKKRPVARAER